MCTCTANMNTAYMLLTITLIKIVAADIVYIALPSSEAIEATRLVGGPVSTRGRVELRVGGQWGTVCNDKADNNLARVVCKMAGFGDSHGAVDSVLYTPLGTGNIWLDDVICTGDEQTLTDCAHRAFSSHNCQHNEDLAIDCGVPYVATTNVTGIRLVGGDGTSGRVEIQRSGEWGTICKTGLRDGDAQVLCRMLGLNVNHVQIIETVQPLATGLIMIANLICSGSESWLTECIDYEIVSPRCQHSDDLAITCGGGPTVDGIRLVGGTRTEGRVEIQLNGAWGSVCDDVFDSNDNGARVVCRMLGLNTAHARHVPNTEYSAASPVISPILLDSVTCTGSESTLAGCTYTYQNHDCAESEAVAVRCPDTVLLINASRLTTQGRDGVVNAESAGRLEVQIEGAWGTVCDDGFDRNAGQVACRMLGLPSVNPRIISTGSDRALPILLDEISCTGSERSLTECPGYAYLKNDCSHSEDVHLVCNEATPNITGVRLVGGNRTTGRVEIEIDGVWGSVCDDSFDRDASAARVVCRMLGFNGGMAEVVQQQFSPASTGPIMFDQMICEGGEFNLVDCMFYYYKINDCTHSEDVAIKCNE